MIKMFGWEERIKVRVATKREKELGLIWKRRLMSLCVCQGYMGTSLTLVQSSEPYQSLLARIDHVCDLCVLHCCAEAGVDRCEG